MNQRVTCVTGRLRLSVRWAGVRRAVTMILAAGSLFVIVSPVGAQSTAVRSRITGRIDDGNLTARGGNTHPLARPQDDQGAVADSQPMRRMLLSLRRAPEQQAALKQLLDQQQSSGSANYHQWLTPQQFGQQFGPADADIQTVTQWLQSQGFQVNRLSAGKTVIEFSGNAGQVRKAFHTEIHKYLVNGQQHLANASDPQIPTTLAQVVGGPVTLHNFSRKAQSHVRGPFSRVSDTGEVKPMGPLFTGNGGGFHALAPGDFNTIYNIPSAVVPSTVNGTGQTIAIVGDSEICTLHSPQFNTGFCNNGTTDDVKQFRQLFGLPTANLPNVILDGPDPGFDVGGDETEGDLDVEWSGAVAPNATIDFVIAQNTETSFGVDLAAEYIVDNNLAPVMSESFGDCEADLGAGGNQFYNSLWEQAAAQGITVIVSSGDSGSAGCDNPNLASPNSAKNGLAVNGIASTPFNVAAGGTDFDFAATGYPTTYWKTTNDAGTQASARSYIPETTWNDSCAGTSAGCASASTSSLNVVGGGGGASSCIDPVLFIGSICRSITFPGSTQPLPGYPKPLWQPTATGSGLTAGTDSQRDVPDISLFASDGLLSNSFYIICEADQQGGDCSTTGNITHFIGVGGTSSTAPTFAAIMALVNQKMASLSLSSRQGNANYILYPLAAQQQTNGYDCNSSHAGTTLDSRCTFNDVTKGNNSVPCVSGSPNCANGILVNGSTPAWNAGTGYDLATGLGTINAANLINNWATVEGNFTSTTTSLCMVAGAVATPCATASISITHGTNVSGTIGVTPNPGASTTTKPEDVSLIGVFPGGASVGVDHFNPNTGNADIYRLDGNGQFVGVFTRELVGGSYNVNAHYAGDGHFGPSDSNAISLTVAPENSTSRVTVQTVNLVTNTVSTLTSVPYGDLNLVRADVVGAASGLETATGSVTFTDNGNPIINPNGGTTSPSNFNLNTEGYLEDQTTFLAVGTHSFVAKYNGDASYNASTSGAVSFVVTQAPTVTSVNATNNCALPAAPASTTVHAGSPITLNVCVDTEVSSNPGGGSFGRFPTGTITLTIPATSALFRPSAPQPGPTQPKTWLAAATGASLALLFLLFILPLGDRVTIPRWGTASIVMLFAIVIGAAVSCGGGSTSSGGGGSQAAG